MSELEGGKKGDKMFQINHKLVLAALPLVGWPYNVFHPGPSHRRQHLKHFVLGRLAQLVRELDVEGDKDVAALVGLLRLGQAVAGDPLHGGGLDDLGGEVDGYLLGGEGGYVHQYATQRLKTE